MGPTEGGVLERAARGKKKLTVPVAFSCSRALGIVAVDVNKKNQETKFIHEDNERILAMTEMEDGRLKEEKKYKELSLKKICGFSSLNGRGSKEGALRGHAQFISPVESRRSKSWWRRRRRRSWARQATSGRTSHWRLKLIGPQVSCGKN